jgi:hypothetical protein
VIALPEPPMCPPERSEGSLLLAFRLPLIRVRIGICVTRWVSVRFLAPLGMTGF